MKSKKAKILLMIIFVASAFIVSLTSTAEDSAFMVPGDYSTIQEAISAASNGDTVYVGAGTYSPSKNGEMFPIYMKNGVSLVGEGADVCILDAEETSKVIVCNFITKTSTKIEGFTITNGSGDFGAGIFCFWLSYPAITNNIITGNRASKGGGIYCWFSSPSIINNVITGNSASSSGGGIYCDVSFPTITNNVITGNEALGELWKDGGGGIYCLSSSPTVTNNIISENTSNSGGGGIHCYSSSSTFIAYNNVWENIPQDYWGCGPGAECISADPMFVDPSLVDYTLRAGSPCIDVGDNDASGLPEFDFEGNPRIMDGNGDGAAVVDMGAFENQGVLAIEATIDIDPDTLNLTSKGRWITAYIELPAGYDVADINVSTLLLNGSVQAESKPASIGDDDNDEIIDLMVKFDRALVEGLLEVGDNVEITVSGSLSDGTQLAGTDTIRVIRKGKK
jgi:parallel beta-helix repeat protein